ncbi:MAG: dicarboxylate/amino acid:cation symporter [Coxiellaceae bacterium]|nr:dicarboxylate/amino acid:cation symporter [Coxiellaceae bacterium]
MQKHHHYTLKIVIGMVLGIIVGLCLQYVPWLSGIQNILSVDIFGVLGQIFIRLMKMLVVPIVFVSLVCGVTNLTNIRSLGNIGIKAIVLYLFTTAVAISLAIFCADIFQVGEGLNVKPVSDFVMKQAPSIKTVLLNLFPVNPMNALAEGNMLQIIVFALLLGCAMVLVGDKSKKLSDVFDSANEVLMKLIMVIMELAPYGVFFLLASLFTRMQLVDVVQLLGYFATVIVVLILQFLFVYSAILWVLTRKSPIWFMRGIYPAMLFAFSVSSSNVSIPVTLQTVKERLKVKPAVASFVVPLGATINMDGTAIMQGVATVFIAHAYHIPLGIGSYLTVIGMATLASVGTAGVPGVGLITLAMVLEQVGLPVEGIALIIGVDRLLDMARTAVNVAGDAMVSVIAA